MQGQKKMDSCPDLRLMDTDTLDRTADVALLWWYVEQNTHTHSLHTNKLTVL